MVLGAILLAALCLRALAGANRYGNATDQLRVELALSTVVTVIISVAVILLIVYVGERPGRLRAELVARSSRSDQEVWPVRVDPRARAVLAAMSRADANQLAKPGLYFVVVFDADGMTVITSTKETAARYLVPRARIRRVRGLAYSIPNGKSNSISVEFDRDGKRFDLPLVLVEWKSISHRPVNEARNAQVISQLQSLWNVTDQSARPQRS